MPTSASVWYKYRRFLNEKMYWYCFGDFSRYIGILRERTRPGNRRSKSDPCRRMRQKSSLSNPTVFDRTDFKAAAVDELARI